MAQSSPPTPRGAAMRAAAAAPSQAASSALSGEELRCVVAVIRHGDRTPKQKMKVRVRAPALLALHRDYSKGPREEAKLKSAKQLQIVLEVTRELIGARLAAAAAAGGRAAGADGGGGECASVAASAVAAAAKRVREHACMRARRLSL